MLMKEIEHCMISLSLIKDKAFERIATEEEATSIEAMSCKVALGKSTTG